MNQAHRPLAQVSLAEKIAALSRPLTYGGSVTGVDRRETHMSWVFFAGDRVYKLKKPVRLPYLDFSTLARREAACRAELRLNRRLAPDVYLAVTPLVQAPGGLALGGPGLVVDWLVQMRRLDETRMLDARLRNHVRDSELDRVANVLAGFYRRASRVAISPHAYLAGWGAQLDYDRKVLLDPRLGLPCGPVRRIHGVLRRFLRARRFLLEARAGQRRIVDAHGDLRPEHIWLGDGVRIIDCLEFNASLRANDPLKEIAALDLECRLLGAPEAGARFHRKIGQAPPGAALEALYLFYRCAQASLRARLTIAHLLEPNPRTPQVWPTRARQYLRLAMMDAVQLERKLRTPSDR